MIGREHLLLLMAAYKPAIRRMSPPTAQECVELIRQRIWGKGDIYIYDRKGETIRHR